VLEKLLRVFRNFQKFEEFFWVIKNFLGFLGVFRNFYEFSEVLLKFSEFWNNVTEEFSRISRNLGIACNFSGTWGAFRRF
jgi:hypothetical protein